MRLQFDYSLLQFGYSGEPPLAYVTQFVVGISLWLGNDRRKYQTKYSMEPPPADVTKFAISHNFHFFIIS